MDATPIGYDRLEQLFTLIIGWRLLGCQIGIIGSVVHPAIDWIQSRVFYEWAV